MPSKAWTLTSNSLCASQGETGEVILLGRTEREFVLLTLSDCNKVVVFNMWVQGWREKDVYAHICTIWASLVAQMVKNLPLKQETRILSLAQEDPLEKGMVTHSSIPPWRIPWTEAPGGLQSMGPQRVGHDWQLPAPVRS